MIKIACKEKVTNSRAAKDFQNELDIKKIPKYEIRPTGSEIFRDSHPTQEITYGIKNRPPTPIKDVLEFKNLQPIVSFLV